MRMNLKTVIESVLFVAGEPLTVSRITKITGRKPAEVLGALRELAGEYRERGIQLLENGEEWQFATHPANKGVVEKLITAELSEDLSRASREVLSIIAYKGPMSRAAIEYIRGVNSSFTLRNLLIRGLVSREESPSDRRAYLYCISMDFLKYLGLARPEELPQYEAFRKKELELPSLPEKAGDVNTP